MKNGRTTLAVTAVLLLTVAVLLAERANDQDKQNVPPKDVVVDFGQPQPQSVDPVAAHVLLPDEAKVREGGTVTFNVNGSGHGIAIYPVSKNTTREDISDDLCQGGAGVCNATTGTANLPYNIVDGRHHLIIETDTAANQPRIDDPFHRFLSTSGSAPGPPVTPGVFLAGSAPTAAGNRIQVRFEKAGRYLVVCQNRAHLINDWMFGFVNVMEKDDDGHGHQD